MEEKKEEERFWGAQAVWNIKREKEENLCLFQHVAEGLALRA